VTVQWCSRCGVRPGLVYPPAYLDGDGDPSGQDAARDIEAKLREYAPAGSFVFEQVAVTPEQIRAYQLPTRPTKQTDTRAKGFSTISVELDALPPDILRGLVRDVIEAHLPDGYMANLRFVEQEERRGFARLLRGWANNGGGGDLSAML
jgi:hypothetical protein